MVDFEDDDDFNYCDCADKAPQGEYWICPKCDAEWYPEDDEELTNDR